MPVVIAVHRIEDCTEGPLNNPDPIRPDSIGRHVLSSVFIYGFCLPVCLPLSFLLRIAGPAAQRAEPGISFCRSPMQPPLVATTHLRRTVACSWKATAMETEGWNRMLRVLRC